ncbi:MAG: flagellar hook-length control protein FliK [Rhodobacteraceae bacterium]|nr:flagellar hook-length control protein FliK [Paracoccaceae bacterium]
MPSGVAPSGVVLAPPPLADDGAGVAMGAQGVAADAPGAGGETAARVSAPVVANGAPLSQAPAAGVPPTLVPVAGADATAHSPVGRRDRGDAAGSARATPASGVTPTTASAPQAAMIRPDAAPLAGTSGGAGALPDPGSSGEPGAGRAHDAATGGVFAAAPVGHGAPPAPHIASAADMPGVSRQILAALAQSPGGAVDVTLSPDELGRVRLSLSTTDLGGIVVNVTADRAETMDLIRRHIDMLAQDFREIGYGSVSFGFSDNPGRNDGQAPVALAGSHLSPVALSVIPEIALVPAAGTGLDLRL